MADTATAAPTTAALHITRAELARGLRAVGTLPEAKTIAVDISSDGARLSAYGDDAALRVALEADCDGADSLWVSRSSLAAVLAYCGPELDLRVGTEQLVVASGPTEFRLPRDLPPTSDPTRGHDLERPIRRPAKIEAPVIVEALRRVLPFVSRDMSRPLLACAALYPKRHLLVGTDSYRLAVIRYGDDDDPAEAPVLLAAAGAASMLRLLAKTLGVVEITKPKIGKTEVFVDVRFEALRWSLRCPRIIDETRSSFPKWENLMPDDAFATVVGVDREDLLAAARAAKLVAKRYEPMRVIVADATARVSAGQRGAAQVTRHLESATIEGDDIEFGVNATFLADLAAAAPVEHLKIGLRSPLRPMVVEAARDMYLLMPIRLNV